MTVSLSQVRIAFIGAGNMAQALIGGLIARGADPRLLCAIDPAAERRSALAEGFGIATHAACSAEALAVDVAVLAVKPQQMAEAAQAAAPHLSGALVLSVAAGVRIATLSNWLGGHKRVVRTMPNTPALVGLGATGLAASPTVGAADRALAEAILAAVGITVWVEGEAQLDAVTALSGSGPAYVFRFIETMIAGGQSLGLSADQARRLSLQTVLGAATLAAQSAESPAVLRERVTSKGGTTAAGLAVFAERRLEEVVAQAMAAACRRSEELGRPSDAQP